MAGGVSRPGVEYSDDSDSETEEYKELEPSVNPVTGRELSSLEGSHWCTAWSCGVTLLIAGRFEAVRPNPTEGMSDEQKEYEAMQLLNAMDRLQKLGVIQPSRIGEDGRPEPVEHILQLTEGQSEPPVPDDDDD